MDNRSTSSCFYRSTSCQLLLLWSAEEMRSLVAKASAIWRKSRGNELIPHSPSQLYVLWCLVETKECVLRVVIKVIATIWFVIYMSNLWHIIVMFVGFMFCTNARNRCLKHTRIWLPCGVLWGSQQQTKYLATQFGNVQSMNLWTFLLFLNFYRKDTEPQASPVENLGK